MSYKFFQNKECEWFPCHSTHNIENFNCLFCFCPLYLTNCSGKYQILDNGIKDCSECLIPHYNYEHIINEIIKNNQRGKHDISDSE